MNYLKTCRPCCSTTEHEALHGMSLFQLRKRMGVGTPGLAPLESSPHRTPRGGETVVGVGVRGKKKHHHDSHLPQPPPPLTGGFLMSTRHWCVSGTSGTQILAPRTWTRQLPAALIPGKQHRAQAAHWKDGSTSYLWGNWLDLWRPIQAGRNWARLAIKSTMPSKDNLNSY